VFTGDIFAVSVIVVALIMSAKETLLDIAEKLPPDATLVDAIYELEFRRPWKKVWPNSIAAKASPFNRSKPRLPHGLASNHRPVGAI
jgi:hypothetical protein